METATMASTFSYSSSSKMCGKIYEPCSCDCRRGQTENLVLVFIFAFIFMGFLIAYYIAYKACTAPIPTYTDTSSESDSHDVSQSSSSSPRPTPPTTPSRPSSLPISKKLTAQPGGDIELHSPPRGFSKIDGEHSPNHFAEKKFSSSSFAELISPRRTQRNWEPPMSQDNVIEVGSSMFPFLRSSSVKRFQKKYAPAGTKEEIELTCAVSYRHQDEPNLRRSPQGAYGGNRSVRFKSEPTNWKLPVSKPIVKKPAGVKKIYDDHDGVKAPLLSSKSTEAIFSSPVPLHQSSTTGPPSARTIRPLSFDFSSKEVKRSRPNELLPKSASLIIPIMEKGTGVVGDSRSRSTFSVASSKTKESETWWTASTASIDTLIPRAKSVDLMNFSIESGGNRATLSKSLNSLSLSDILAESFRKDSEKEVEPDAASGDSHFASSDNEAGISPASACELSDDEETAPPSV